jgi:hypothetical protein
MFTLLLCWFPIEIMFLTAKNNAEIPESCTSSMDGLIYGSVTFFYAMPLRNTNTVNLALGKSKSRVRIYFVWGVCSFYLW